MEAHNYRDNNTRVTVVNHPWCSREAEDRRSSNTVSLGKVVRRRRKQLGWSVETLAGKARLSPNYLGLLEREAKRNPSLGAVRLLAKALGVSLSELLGDDQGLSPAGVEAAKLVDALSGDDQDLVLRLMRSLGRRRSPKA